jgi:hypothetical protein
MENPEHDYNCSFETMGVASIPTQYFIRKVTSDCSE